MVERLRNYGWDVEPFLTGTSTPPNSKARFGLPRLLLLRAFSSQKTRAGP